MSGMALAETYELVEERKAYFPNNYKGVATAVGTGSQTNPPSTYLHSGRFNTAPLMEFRVEQKTYVTSKPILVKVCREDDIFIAENESLVLSGSGASREDAVLDFVKHLDYFYNFYKRQNESNLMGDALRLKRIYDNLVIET